MENNNIRLNIGHSLDELGVDEAISTYRDALEGYVYSINDVSFTSDEFKKIIGELKEIFPDLSTYDYSRGNNNLFKKFTSNSFKGYVRGNSIDLYGSFYFKTEEDCLAAWEIYIKHSKEENEVEMFTYSYSMNNGSLQETVKVFKKEELDYISHLYYPYLDVDVMLDQFFTGSENILLLVGEPGLGKSKLSTMALKYAINNPDKIPYDKIKQNPSLENQFINTVFVKSTEVLANDSFWRTLEKNSPDFCIIDDLDYMLTKRDAEVMSSDDAIKNSFLNQFLSYTDGVEKNKTKFIITTNQSYEDIDSALLRKGRLFDILELRELDKHEGLIIWTDNNLDEQIFHELFNTHEILPAELGSEINKRLNKRIDKSTSTYLKEDGISKVQKAGRKKKIGL